MSYELDWWLVVGGGVGCFSGVLTIPMHLSINEFNVI